MLGEIKTLRTLSIAANKLETIHCNYSSESLNGLYGINVINFIKEFGLFGS
jgi:hypothetical protein